MHSHSITTQEGFMDRDDRICDRCLKVIGERLTESDWEVIFALQKGGTMNKSALMTMTGLSISDVRDSVWRLFGGCLIYLTRKGKETLMKLTPSAIRLIDLQKQAYREEA